MSARLAAALLVLMVTGCTQPTTTSHFDSEGISFDYPSTWNASTFDISSSFKTVVVTLSTEPLSDPCVRTSDSISCTESPIGGPLTPDGFLATWSANAFPGWTFDPSAGESIRVGDVEATIELGIASPGCLTMSGQSQLKVIVPAEALGNFWAFLACINAPFDGTIRDQILAMLASVQWH